MNEIGALAPPPDATRFRRGAFSGNLMSEPGPLSVALILIFEPLATSVVKRHRTQDMLPPIKSIRE